MALGRVSSANPRLGRIYSQQVDLTADSSFLFPSGRWSRRNTPEIRSSETRYVYTLAVGHAVGTDDTLLFGYFLSVLPPCFPTSYRDAVWRWDNGEIVSRPSYTLDSQVAPEERLCCDTVG